MNYKYNFYEALDFNEKLFNKINSCKEGNWKDNCVKELLDLLQANRKIILEDQKLEEALMKGGDITRRKTAGTKRKNQKTRNKKPKKQKSKKVN